VFGFAISQVNRILKDRLTVAINFSFTPARYLGGMYSTDDIAIEMARLVREAEAAVAAKLAARQLGELFYDLPTNTTEEN
jgi:hypothetical protein